jgi:Zn-dependent protease
MSLLITIISLAVILFSIIIHEIAHGSVAYYLGDPTAKENNRLSLNPLNHLDPIGSFLVPLLLIWTGGPVFGWAKPVPVDFYAISNKKWAELKVSLAGPAANLLIAIIFGLIIRLPILNPNFYYFLQIVIFYNIILAVFNLMPIPPLDGSHILFELLGDKFQSLKAFLSQFGIFILLLFIFYGTGIIFNVSQKIYYLIVGLPLI